MIRNEDLKGKYTLLHEMFNKYRDKSYVVEVTLNHSEKTGFKWYTLNVYTFKKKEFINIMYFSSDGEKTISEYMVKSKSHSN